MTDRIQQALAALRLLWGLQPVDPFAAALYRVLNMMRAGKITPGLTVPDDGAEDVIDALNALADLVAGAFRKTLDEALFQALSDRVPDLKTLEQTGTDGAFLLRHAVTLADILVTLIPDYTAQYPENALRLLPSARLLSASGTLFGKLKPAAVMLECARRRSAAEDLVSGSRVFRYEQNTFTPLDLKNIRPVEAFYGYQEARRTFLDHFGAFAAGKSNLPLLISSLPGLGKTQMTIAHSLHYPQITLILASPDVLSHGLENMIKALAAAPKRKFVVFFDDIDVPQMDWYDFRTHVGGAFSPPDHISFTIAANQQFPANISSRGRGFLFPIFDEIRCQEMVEDFLIASGMKNPTPELISVIAADYVESFGQKLFEELSPRTLVRYLEQYRTDSARRMRMLDSSRQQVITRPDPQVFYDENLKLMRAIYGDSVLDEIRNRELAGGIS